MIAEFIIHAAPVGKARPRVTRNGTFTPAKTREYEKLVRVEYGEQCGAQYFGDSPLAVSITAYYPIPKSASKRRREQMESRLIRPTIKPDSDNICKAVCDALNGIAWKDDAQIVNLGFEKYYGTEPRVKVEIEEVKE